MQRSTVLMFSTTLFLISGLLNFSNGLLQRITVFLLEDQDYEFTSGLLVNGSIATYVGLFALGLSVMFYHFYSKQREIERLELK